MKKKVLLAVAVAMAITSVSFASPLSNYEKGSVAIDLNTKISPDVEEYIGRNTGIYKTFDGKSRLGAGVTYGIGNNLALQYKYSDNKTKDFYNWYDRPESYNRERHQLTGYEFNVLYRINHNVSAFMGYTRSITKLKLEFRSDNVANTQNKKDSRDGYQIGVIGQTKIADDITGWGSVSAGNRVTSYEIGLGYDVAKNTELNLFYRHTKYKDFNFGGFDLDYTIKGLGAGVTVKF